MKAKIRKIENRIKRQIEKRKLRKEYQDAIKELTEKLESDEMIGT